MSKKLKVGIDINEVFRAKWLQFDRFYTQEFGEEGIPEQPYVYDFFKNYKFEDTVEFIKWNRAGGKVLEGLTRRRNAEKELFIHGLKDLTINDIIRG